jgi:hypothetical protein
VSAGFEDRHMKTLEFKLPEDRATFTPKTKPPPVARGFVDFKY